MPRAQVYENAKIDGWVGGWMDILVDGWMDGWIYSIGSVSKNSRPYPINYQRYLVLHWNMLLCPLK